MELVFGKVRYHSPRIGREREREREKSPRKYSSQKLVTYLRTHYDFRYNYKTTQKKNKQKGTLPKESPSFIDTLKIIPSLEH